MEVGLRDYVAGAALMTDLVLTAPGLRLGDRLTSVAELRGLFETHGLATTRLRRADLADVRALRAELFDLFDADAAEQARLASALLAQCPHRVVAGPEHVAGKHGDWRLRAVEGTTPVQQLRLVAGAATLAVLHALGPERFRRCDATDSCTGRFVDTSTTGRRRFCLPKVCGNRVNVARYRARRAAG